MERAEVVIGKNAAFRNLPKTFLLSLTLCICSIANWELSWAASTFQPKLGCAHYDAIHFVSARPRLPLASAINGPVM